MNRSDFMNLCGVYFLHTVNLGDFIHKIKKIKGPSTSVKRCRLHACFSVSGKKPHEETRCLSLCLFGLIPEQR